jgi:hypothetical protein
MKDDEAHSDAGCLSNTPRSHNLSTSLMMMFYVFLEQRKLGHDRVVPLPLIGERPA